MLSRFKLFLSAYGKETDDFVVSKKKFESDIIVV